MNSIQRSLFWSASVLGTVLVAAPANGAVINQTVTQGLGAHWNQAAWGSPAAVPAGGNAYVTPSGFDVRTPDVQSPSLFLGDTLQIDAGGRLVLKNGGAGNGVATVNLILNGGSITYNTANGTTISAIAGTVLVQDSSTINSVAGGSTRDVWLRSSLSGSGNLTVGMVNNALVLFGTNSAYSGNWTVNSGRIEIGSNAQSPLGSGTVLLSGLANAVTFNATNDFTIDNVIDGFGAIVKLNTNTVTLGGINPLAGTAVISNGVLRLNHAGAIGSVSVITLAGGTIDATPIGGLALNEGFGQVLNSRGTVMGSLTAGSANTLNFNLSALTNDVLNITGALTLNGTPALNLALAGFKPGGTYRLINYNGTIQGGGSFNLVPPPESTATFQLDTSTPGQVNLIITSASQNLTWVGDGAGNSWDTVSPNWTGTATTFSTGDNVTFTDSGSAVPDIFVAATVQPQNMTVNNSAQPYVFYGEGISTLGTLTKSGPGTLSFTSPANQFNGPVDIRAGTLSIGVGGSFGSLGSPAIITNNGIFKVDLASGGITVDAEITGSGAVELAGGGSTLILRGTNSYTGVTTINNESQLNITTSAALGSPLGGTIVLPNGRLGVNTFVGEMTVAEPIQVGGTGISAAPGALYVNTTGNSVTWAGPVTITSDARFRVVNAGVRMNFANTVLGDNVALQSTVGNGAADATSVMSFQNTFSIGTGAFTKDGQGTVEFLSGSNEAGSTTVNDGTLRVNGTWNGGSVTINSGGALGGSGNVLGPVAVLDGGRLAPGSGGIGTLTLASSVTLAATASTVMEINRTNGQNADKVLVAQFPAAGTLSVVNIGPALEVGDSFKLIDAVVSGSFDTIQLPPLGQPNQTWDTSLLMSQGIIKVAANPLQLLPLEITAIERQASGVKLTWNSYPGVSYAVEYSTNLHDWSGLQQDIAADAATNSTTAVLDLSGAGSGASLVLAQYSMGTAGAQVQNAADLVAAGPLTQGSGLNLFNFNATVTPNYASAPVLQIGFPTAGADLASAVANQAWFTFELTVGSNVTDLDLTGLTFNGARGGGASPRGYGVYVTTPSTTDEQVQGATDFPTQRPAWSAQNISLAGIASLQNLTAGQTITFKIPFYAPNPGQSAEFDDITVLGNVSPGPLPPYAGATQLFLRIKQQ
ncbi:MAG TPA: autotransporter-associated beta strand repeat-containing protein [Verrucomicrobiae bacterium]|nr:autotransporter-associated beta strand repeat-containing protein [Verrucomicrobiae bacterium]